MFLYIYKYSNAYNAFSLYYLYTDDLVVFVVATTTLLIHTHIHTNNTYFKSGTNLHNINTEFNVDL